MEKVNYVATNFEEVNSSSNGQFFMEYGRYMDNVYCTVYDKDAGDTRATQVVLHFAAATPKAAKNLVTKTPIKNIVDIVKAVRTLSVTHDIVWRKEFKRFMTALNPGRPRLRKG